MAGRYVRGDVWTLAPGAAPPWPEHLLAYARAVGAMRRRPAADPTSWAAQTALHAGAPRGSWFFLPWLRMRLWYFERIVRAAVVAAGGPADWALPFWNPADGPQGSAAMPRAFAEATLPDGSPNPLHVPDGPRAAWLNAGAALLPTVASAARALHAPAFSPGFGGLACGPGAAPGDGPHGLLESEPHDSVAAVIGPAAARDPVLPLHLANVDRLWEVWLAAGGTHANPARFDWTDQAFHFHDADGRERSMTCGQVGDLANLDYAYADVPGGGEPRAGRTGPFADDEPIPCHPGDGPRIAIGDGARLGLESRAVALERPPDARPLAEVAREAGAALAPRVYLHVEDARLEAASAGPSPGLVWEVRIGSGEAGAGGAPVGTIALGGGGPDGGRFLFDITDAVDALEVAGRWDERRVVVAFEPAVPDRCRAANGSAQGPRARVERVFVTHG